MISIALCLLLILVAGICAIPVEVRTLMLENCRGANGWLHPIYTLRELVALANFFAGILFFAIVIGTITLCVVELVDRHLVPLHVVRSAVSKFNPDPNVWKHELRTGENNLSQQFTESHVLSGGTKEGAENLQRYLWGAIPFAVLASFIAIVSCLRLTSKSYLAAIDELIKDEVNRMSRRLARTYEN